MRKLNDCQIVGPYPFGIPTLQGNPPPVGRAHEEPAIPLKRRVAPVSYAPPSVRSRSYRQLHDCLFIPNFQTVAELVDARRYILEYESLGRRRPWRRESRLTSPLAIGLMLAFLPPLAVSLVWSSKHFAQPAKVAITVYGMFTFVALLVAAFLGLHG